VSTWIGSPAWHSFLKRGVSVDGEVTQTRVDVGRVGPDHDHDAVGGVRENLTIAALVHMAVIVGPIDRNDALGFFFDLPEFSERNVAS